MARERSNRWVYVKTEKKPKGRYRSESEEANAYFSVRAQVIGLPITTYLVLMPDGEERTVTNADLQFVRRESDPITVTDDDRKWREGTVSTHPSFGMIGISHVSGGRPIHGSKLDSHQHYVQITITRGAEESHDLGRNWHHGGGDRIVEVLLSSARFAEFLSSPNRGEGIPCSIDYHSPVPGPGMIPTWDARDTELEKVIDRIKAIGKEAVDRQSAARDSILPLIKGMSKKRQEAILSAFDQGARSLHDSAPFLVKSGVEALESRVVEAKAEVEAFVTSAIMSAGREAITEDPSKLIGDYSIPGAKRIEVKDSGKTFITESDVPPYEFSPDWLTGTVDVGSLTVGRYSGDVSFDGVLIGNADISLTDEALWEKAVSIYWESL